MKHAESVIFGGSGFERATELRRNPETLARLLAQANARVLPVWRGKPLFTGEGLAAIGFVSPDHPALKDAVEMPVFLGLDGETPVFAQDISYWSGPDHGDDNEGRLFDVQDYPHPALPDSQRFADLRMNMTRLTPRDGELAAMAVGVFAWHHTHKFCAHCGARSKITMGGWQRSCPACDRQHFPRTDPVVIMLITRGNSVLIGRSPNWPEGMYSLLAGFMEPGETIEAAVRREVFEETAVSVGKVGYLASQPWPFPSSLMIGCWGLATSEEITIDSKEIEAAKWVSREEILEAWASRSTTLIAARKGAIANFLIRNWLSDTLS